MDCDHDTFTITTDDGDSTEICPICDDVTVETTDGDDNE